MKPNRSIDLSQQLYRRLLRLYPQSYREHYESEMFHVFTDQCRETYQGRGGWGLLSLWLRTFVDVGKTVVIEHISHPNSKVGLLEAMPNAPLPWKGVLLVLIPGLIFFISQIAQVTSDMDWFFIAYYRAAFYLIVPVLLVWTSTRRFPIWGLIPLGLLYGTLGSYGPGYLIDKLPFLKLSDTLVLSGITFDLNYLMPVSVCVALLCGLIWYTARHRQISRSASGWLALYGALIIFPIAVEVQRRIAQEVIYSGSDWQTILGSADMKQFLFEMPLWYLYTPLSFLLLVFIGKIFVRKHGGLSFLLLLGYLLPTIVFGRYGEWAEFVPFYVVTSAVLMYRFVVALIAPIWLVREASIPGRQRAAVIPVAVAIICHITLTMIVHIAWATQHAYQANILDLALIVWNQLLVAVGLGLAVALYLPREKDTPIVSPPLEIVTE